MTTAAAGSVNIRSSVICFAPVLSLKEAREHPRNAARGSSVSVNGVPQPQPALVPRFFSRTAAAQQWFAHDHATCAVLAELGHDAEHIADCGE